MHPCQTLIVARTGASKESYLVFVISRLIVNVEAILLGLDSVPVHCIVVDDLFEIVIK